MKRYRSNSSYLVKLTIGIIALLILGYFERGFDYTSLFGVVIGVVLISGALLSRNNTYLEISADKLILTISGQREPLGGKYDIKIKDIDYILRIPLWRIKFWSGAYIGIYIRHDGNVKKGYIREANFSEKTIKAFLVDLKGINSSIIIDQTYVDFIDGKIEDGTLKNKLVNKSISQVEDQYGVNDR